MNGSRQSDSHPHRPQRVILYVRPLHVYHHFENGQGQDARLEEIKSLLVQLKSQGVSIVATLAEFQAAFARVDTATTEIGEDIQRLLDKIAAGGMTDAEEATALAAIGAQAERLEGIASSVENPVPPAPPVTP